MRHTQWVDKYYEDKRGRDAEGGRKSQMCRRDSLGLETRRFGPQRRERERERQRERDREREKQTERESESARARAYAALCLKKDARGRERDR